MRHSMRLAFLSLALVAGAAARAQSSAVTHVLTTVDGVEWGGSSELVITGIQRGEQAATSITVRLYGTEAIASCERKALLAMSKPGQYLLTLYSPYAGAYTSCGLTKVAP